PYISQQPISYPAYLGDNWISRQFDRVGQLFSRGGGQAPDFSGLNPYGKRR
ncbi:hypothetical protein AAVH_43213, partial [Aphelenchoides avenae]